MQTKLSSESLSTVGRSHLSSPSLRIHRKQLSGSISTSQLHLPLLPARPRRIATKSYESSPRYHPAAEQLVLRASLQMYGTVAESCKAATVSRSEAGMGGNGGGKLGLNKPPLSKRQKTGGNLRRESLPSDFYTQTMAAVPGVSQERTWNTMRDLACFETETHKSRSRHISPKPEDLVSTPIVPEIKLKGPLEIQPVLHLRRIESKELMRSDSDEDAKLPVLPHTHRPADHKPALLHFEKADDPSPMQSERHLTQAMRKLLTDYNFATAAVLNETQSRFREVQKIPQRLLSL